MFYLATSCQLRLEGNSLLPPPHLSTAKWQTEKMRQVEAAGCWGPDSPRSTGRKCWSWRDTMKEAAAAYQELIQQE